MTIETTDAKVRVGLIGGMGRAPALGRCFNLTGRAEVVAVADINPASFEVGKERYEAGGAKPDLYTDVAGMLKRKDLDWVVLGTPDRTHFALAKQVIEAGHSLCIEKPMTQSTADADALCDLVAKTGARVVVGCELRYSTFVQTFAKAIRSGMIGRPVSGVHIDHLGRGYSYFLRDLRKKQWGRGLLMQKGVHAIDMMIHLLQSDPVRVFGSGSLAFFGGKPETKDRYCRDCEKQDYCQYGFKTVTSPTWVKGGPRDKGEHAFDHCVFMPDTDTEDNMHLLIDFQSGARFSFTSVFFAGQYNTHEIFLWGTEGTLHGLMRSPQPTITFTPYTAGKRSSTRKVIPVEKSTGDHGGADKRFVEAIVNATRSGMHLVPDVWDGRAAVAVAEYGLKSIETAQPYDIAPRPDWAWKR